MQITKLEGPMEDRLKLDNDELAIIKKALATKLFKSGGSLEERLPRFQTMITELEEFLKGQRRGSPGNEK